MPRLQTEGVLAFSRGSNRVVLKGRRVAARRGLPVRLSALDATLNGAWAAMQSTHWRGTPSDATRVPGFEEIGSAWISKLTGRFITKA